MIRFRVAMAAFGLVALVASAAAPVTADAASARAAQGQPGNGATTRPKVSPFTPAPALPVSARPAVENVPTLQQYSAYAVRTVRPSALVAAEAAFRAGRSGEALAQFRALAASGLDEERRGFAWARTGELLLAANDLDGALSAADNALLLTRARYLVLSAMDLKMRIARRLPERSAEVRDLAGYLIDQKFVDGDRSTLLSVMARSEAGAGRLARAMALFRQAADAAPSPEEAARLHAERDTLVDAVEDPVALFRAADLDEDPEARGRLYFALGRIGMKNGYMGMSGWAFDRSARAGGAKAREAAEYLFRIEKILSARPRIVGLVPLSGKLAETGFSVLLGAEVGLRLGRRGDADSAGSPVLRWVDTGGSPERARREYQSWSTDRAVIGFIGPLTGEEGRSVSAAFTPRSAPILYLGQKTVIERPFLYPFGLSPQQEARAVLAHLAKRGATDVFLFAPENGYGKGFSEAVAAAAKENGVRIVKALGYPPGLRDFSKIIRSSVAGSPLARQARNRGRGKAGKPLNGAILIADRWDRVFLIASQLRYYDVFLPLAGFSGWSDEELIRKAGDTVVGALFSVDYADAVPGSQGARFRRDFRDAVHVSPSRFEAMGYDAATLLATAWSSDAGRDARNAAEAMRERIPRMKSYAGVTGSFNFGPAGEMKRRVSLLKVELGNFVPVQDP
jgi:ABC-type branched-subunit amino acid transport system substrate-binding protein/tetratricopeptide (TPR) repeat protein